MKKKVAATERAVHKNGKNSFPLVVRRAGIQVKIYHRRDKGTYDSFTVAHYEQGARQLKPFTTLDAAREHAQTVLQRLVHGEPDDQTLGPLDRLAYQRANSLIEPAGMPVDTAIADYVHLLKLLDGRATPVEAVRGYLQRLDKAPTDRMVADVVHELIKVRAAQNSSPRHVQDLKRRLSRFAESFQCLIGDIPPAEIERWLLGLELAPRSINNYRTALSNLFRFARQRGYIERERRVMEDVPEVIEAQRKVKIYEPKELRSVLCVCPDDFLPYLVLGAFGGFRTSEICRLDWENIGDDEIEVPPSSYRVKSTRLVVMNETLKHWMKVLRKAAGPVVVHKNVANKLLRLIARAGLKSVHNGLRHSYASYALALSRNPDAVCYDMGNSRQMLNRHYRRLVSQDHARAWFALTPDALNQAKTAAETSSTGTIPDHR